MANAGPNGTGLIPDAASDDDDPDAARPPAMAGFGDDDDDDDDDDDETTDSPPAPPATDIDIDGAPPVADGDDDDEGDPPPADALAAAVAEIEARMQRRFDKAVSKAVRNAERKAGRQPVSRTDDDGDDDDDDDDGDDPPPKAKKKSRQAPAPQVDLRTIRVLARDVITEKMDDAGKTERSVVKDVIGEVIPHIDWDAIDDEDEFLENLVDTLTEKAGVLVKTGSDRKVAQLRSQGLLPPKQGQAGSGAGANGGGRGTKDVGQQFKAGGAIAAKRWPGGKRRMGT